MIEFKDREDIFEIMESRAAAVNESIKNWVLKNLAVPQSILGDLPACPYASEALLSKQVGLQIALPETVFSVVEEELLQFFQRGKKMSLLVVESGNDVDVQKTQEFVRAMRDKYFMQDLWLLYDHPALAESVNELSFNHGHYLLFMVQQLSDLVHASRELKKTSYYHSWDPSYFEEVVGLREEYFNKLSASSEKTFSL